MRKWLDPDLDSKVSKWSQPEQNLRCFKGCVSGLENGLIRIWTESRPHEAIWKQICNGFGKVYLGSKVA